MNEFGIYELTAEELLAPVAVQESNCVKSGDL